MDIVPPRHLNFFIYIYTQNFIHFRLQIKFRIHPFVLPHFVLIMTESFDKITFCSLICLLGAIASYNKRDIRIIYVSFFFLKIFQNKILFYTQNIRTYVSLSLFQFLNVKGFTFSNIK